MKKESKMTLRGNTPVEKVPKFLNGVEQVKIKVILEPKKT